MSKWDVSSSGPGRGKTVWKRALARRKRKKFEEYKSRKKGISEVTVLFDIWRVGRPCGSMYGSSGESSESDSRGYPV